MPGLLAGAMSMKYEHVAHKPIHQQTNLKKNKIMPSLLARAMSIEYEHE